VEQAEIEMLVGELETRLDRLRSLYDQYFMGIERLEPLVPRKDVERRMATLRKEQIRNTGLRFKFQTLTQRFNTYQTYWIRISRQIEQGTYRRDVMRATARFGVDPTKERATASEPEEKAAPRVEIPDAALDELMDGSEFLMPLDAEHDPFAEGAPLPAAASVPHTPPKMRERFASVVKLDLEELADPFEEHDPFPKPPPAPEAPVAPQIRARASAPVAFPTDLDPRDSDRRIPAATPLRIAPRPGIAPGSGESLQRPGTLPSVGAPAGVSTRTPAIVPSASPRVALQMPATLPGTGGFPGATPLQRPGTLPSGQRLPGGVSAPPPVPVPGPSVRVPTVPAAPIAPVQPKPAIQAPPLAVRPADPASRPVPAAPPSVPARVAPERAPAPAATPVGDMSSDRFGQVFSKYVETRRAHNEPTHAITRDALAKQLAESTQRLKQKHGGKPIDFEVVVKDGKTILRPVVK
jgi:hypothetical protein